MSVTASASVLDQMTAAIMGDKATAAAKVRGLTPVGEEAAIVIPARVVAPVEPLPEGGPLAGIVFPVEVIIENIQRSLDAALADLERIKMLVQQGGAAPQSPQTKERAADERARIIAEAESAPLQAMTEEVAAGAAAIVAKQEAVTAAFADPPASVFDVAFTAKAAAAQAVTFAQPVVAADGWVCPKHKVFEDRKSPRGREFRGCPQCDEFERPS